MPSEPRIRSPRPSFREDFRRSVVHGIAALLPTILTLVIIVKVLEFVDWYIGRFIRAGLMYIAYHAIGREDLADHLRLPPQAGAGEVYDAFYRAYESQWYVAVLSFLVAITLVYFVGFFTASVAGRGVTRLLGKTITRLPGIRALYPYVKQVTDVFFTTHNIKEFNRVVAVEYPRKGIYSLGLVVGSGLRAIKEATGEDYLAVFIPSSPAPVTGWTVLVNIRDIIDLPLTVEQALKFAISGGVIIPPDQLVILTGGRPVAQKVEPAVLSASSTTEPRP